MVEERDKKGFAETFLSFFQHHEHELTGRSQQNTGTDS